MVVFYKEVCDKRDRDGVPQLDQGVHENSIASWIGGGSIFDFDGYYIIRTDEGQPRQKHIFNKMWN